MTVNHPRKYHGNECLRKWRRFPSAVRGTEERQISLRQDHRSSQLLQDRGRPDPVELSEKPNGTIRTIGLDKCWQNCLCSIDPCIRLNCTHTILVDICLAWLTLYPIMRYKQLTSCLGHFRWYARGTVSAVSTPPNQLLVPPDQFLAQTMTVQVILVSETGNFSGQTVAVLTVVTIKCHGHWPLHARLVPISLWDRIPISCKMVQTSSRIISSQSIMAVYSQ